ncbi:hypothetical protein [Streptomyces aquilus]|uniref:hypothetical protein n=1 Tax=Streptomyces aquilus TaxID=2548456 RepID=UPI003684A0DE
MWVLLPVVRGMARLAPGVGGPLLGVLLLRCVTPGWVLLRPRPPERLLAWAEEAVAVHRARPSHPDRLARALAVHAQALLAVDRYEEACAAADASAAVPEARPSPAERAHLLHVRAQALLETGRVEEALEASRNCVEAYRHSPAPAGRDRSLGSLPGALRTYALVLGVLGHTEQSVLVYEECAALLRSASFRESARFLLVAARVFSELVRGLRELGRYEEALALGPEAREALDGAALAYPRLAPSLRVMLLTNLADCHDATGDRETARTTADEAVAEARKPAAGAVWLIAALRCKAEVLAQVDAPDDELSTLKELADLCAAQSEEHDPLLGRTLDDLARCLRRAGDDAGAVASGERSAAAYRRAVAREAAHEPELARVLTNLSIRQLDAGDAESAVASAREALTLTRRLAESDWQTHHPLTARRLGALARALRSTGDLTATVSCYGEAEAVLQEHRDRPGAEAELVATRSALADALRDRAVAGTPDETVADLRSLLDLAQRADAQYVHATCFRAFNLVRSDEVAHAWQDATGEPYPGHSYPFTTDRGRGSNPAAR